MSLVVAVLVVAVAIGFARGGSLRRLARLPLGRIWLVWLAFAVQFVLAFLSSGLRETLRDPLLITAFALVLLWMRSVWGGMAPVLRAALGLVVLGWVLNLTVITLNEGMPVSPAALDAVGLPSDDIESGDLSKHVELDEDTVLPFLGDVIPLPLVGTLRKAISIGDVAMLGGLLWFVPAAMGSRRDRVAI